MEIIPQQSEPVDPSTFATPESAGRWLLLQFAAAQVRPGDGLYYPQLLWAAADAGGRPSEMQMGLRWLFDRKFVAGHSYHSLKIYLTQSGWEAARDQ